MLEELEIHNLGPIRSALIAPAGGMTAITGETGAGKSMLLSAIRLISGGPSDGGRVSVGARKTENCSCLARFLPPGAPAACCLVVACLVPYWGRSQRSW